MSSKYSPKVDCTKKSFTSALETAFKRTIKKAAEVTGDLIGNKVAVKITKNSRISPQNSSDTV